MSVEISELEIKMQTKSKNEKKTVVLDTEQLKRFKLQIVAELRHSLSSKLKKNSFSR